MKKAYLLPLFLVSLCAASFAADTPFVLKDNDTWVMAGDSITAQRLHTNYIEAFFRTRYPKLHLHFRNSGVPGHATADLIKRFDYDIAAWKPSIISVELGMNDQVAGVPTNYVIGMKKLTDLTRELNARPILISSSPVDDGSMPGEWTGERCKKIHFFTEALNELGKKENIQVIDQYHPLLYIWGKNKMFQNASAVAASVRRLKPTENGPEFDILQAFAKSWEGKPAGVSFGPDNVHVAGAGQVTMAATILMALNVEREVSSATIKPDGTIVAAEGCKIDKVGSNNGKLSFTRLDERSPWPMTEDLASALQLMPGIADLSRYMLTIPGLPNGQYRVTMDGTLVATLNSQELAKGWNMSTVVEGPLGARAKNILALLSQLQGKPINTNWRDASKEKDEAKLAAAQQAIDACEAKVQTACQPAPIRFEIEPVK